MAVDNEDQLADMFTAAAADLCPPITEMLEYSLVAGARRRRRRKAGVLVSGTGALAAAVAVALVLSRPGIGAVHIPAAGGPEPSAADSANGGPTSAANDFRILSSLLTGGSVAQAQGGPVPGADITVDYDDGHGAADVEVVHRLYSTGVPEASSAESCAGWAAGFDAGHRPVGAPPSGCAVATLPGGTKQIEIVTSVDHNGIYDEELELFRIDGVEVVVTEANGVVGGGTSVATRDVPPLSFAQLTTIAADSRW